MCYPFFTCFRCSKEAFLAHKERNLPIFRGASFGPADRRVTEGGVWSCFYASVIILEAFLRWFQTRWGIYHVLGALEGHNWCYRYQRSTFVAWKPWIEGDSTLVALLAAKNRRASHAYTKTRIFLHRGFLSGLSIHIYTVHMLQGAYLFSFGETFHRYTSPFETTFSAVALCDGYDSLVYTRRLTSSIKTQCILMYNTFGRGYVKCGISFITTCLTLFFSFKRMLLKLDTLVQLQYIPASGDL